MQLLSIRFPGFLESIGTTELLVVLVVALLVFGPRKLPEFGRSVGQALRQVRSASDDFMRTWEAEALQEGGTRNGRELRAAANDARARRALPADAPARAAGREAEGDAAVVADTSAQALEARPAAAEV